MRKLFILMLFSAGLSAQSISKQVIAPGGSTISNGNNQLSYTAGEVVVGGMTDEDGSFQLGNGYYPSLDLSVLSIESPATNLLVKVYPNPTKGIVNIKSDSEIKMIKVHSLLGKVILLEKGTRISQIDISELPKGIYLVEFEFKSAEKTVKRIVKD